MAAVRFSNLYYSNPIIVVLGCTGTGKSKLTIEIAKKFNGEVINADAMQMYKGLDILTNKVTTVEQDGIQHHLLGFLSPLQKLTVCEYRNFALNAIKDIVDRKKLPIIVGGTFYYVESVLYDYLIGPPGFEGQGNLTSKTEDELPHKKIKMQEYDEIVNELNKLSNEELHEKLREVDPEMAEKIHPNLRRKILRSIMVYEQHGVTLSFLLKKQQSQPGGCSTGGPLRFSNSIILWLQSDKEVLKKRLDDRVDDMLSRGLLREVIDFYKINEAQELLAKKGEKRGIFQALGLKEFQEFLLLDEEKRTSEEGKKLSENGVDLLKIGTRQYAKRQMKWMNNRFLKNNQRQVPPIYSLDVTDLSKWKENVSDLAAEIVQSHLSGKKPSVEPLPLENNKVEIDKLYKCDCGSILIGKSQYDIHLKSQKHRRRMKRLKKKKEMEDREETLVEAKESVSSDK